MLKLEIDKELIGFQEHLREMEKSRHTIEKYSRDVRKFLDFAGTEWDKETILQYKEFLLANYKISSANSMIASLNNYFCYRGKKDYCIHAFRVRRQIFCDESKELTMSDYKKLVRTAEKRKDKRLAAIIQTLASTGMRISELSYVSVESLETKEIVIDSKGKRRVILIPVSLSSHLKEFCMEEGITEGAIFVTRNGQSVQRQNIWSAMKELSVEAGILPSKVYPHNLRHLFAKVFYERDHDLVRLADYLGHSSVETTRRYTVISSREACLRQLELGLLIHKEK